MVVVTQQVVVSLSIFSEISDKIIFDDYSKSTEIPVHGYIQVGKILKVFKKYFEK